MTARRSSRSWTSDQIESLKINFADWPTYLVAFVCGHSYSATAAKAAQLGLKKSAEFLQGPSSGRLDGKRGSACRFQKGHGTWNKGTKGVTGTHPNCRRTQFRKGDRRGAASRNYVPIGTTRITRDGMLERKITDDPEIYPARRWVAVSRLVWEAQYGVIPSGHAVVFKKGMATTDEACITTDALELVSRAELMRRNSYHTRYPKEVGRLIQLKGALNRKINARSKKA
ncbi:hypothetical protein ABB29_12170 [Pseudoxanthomonas dokdonensis]|uniref:HNH nuclease domain-containing protein n=1 Tax=Pseudoxanthomonas dokdonensis TaxID=344882 RepID=A0A0R0CU30_9GAMM|nr:hypothetical protein ABB29_12170 [Pseudoxanthomonas dokdonensis]